jgi:hypothetical protein
MESPEFTRGCLGHHIAVTTATRKTEGEVELKRAVDNSMRVVAPPIKGAIGDQR